MPVQMRRAKDEIYLHRDERTGTGAWVPATQYVRMSDESRKYSPDNQKDAIQQYAALHGFKVVQTYADLGRSGVVAKNSTGLSESLKDVVSGEAEYKAILVYDVSRWGRYPNSDEAAHDEYVRSSSGIPPHYCAESFANDGTATSSLLKSLKRSMAAEFSRELGERVYRGKKPTSSNGFLGRRSCGLWLAAANDFSRWTAETGTKSWGTEKSHHGSSHPYSGSSRGIESHSYDF